MVFGMPLFLTMCKDRDRFPIVLLIVMTRGPHSEDSRINSGGCQTTHITGTILLKTNLHQEGYRSLAHYMSVDNIKLRVETNDKNINTVKLEYCMPSLVNSRQFLCIGLFSVE